MRHLPISSDLPIANRKKITSQMAPRSIAIVNANDGHLTNSDGSASYYPNSDLFYLSGVEQEQSILLLAPDAGDPSMREILFVREPNEHLATWEGHKLTADQTRELSGIKRIEWLDRFPVLFRMLMTELDALYINTNEHPRADIETEDRNMRFIRDTQRIFPIHAYKRLAPLLRNARTVKSQQEIDLLQKAVDITEDAWRVVAPKIKPGIFEFEVEAEFSREFIRNRSRFSFLPIIASGKNACTLHYVTNDQPCNDGDLLLVDLGATYANYNSDVTRTIPVNGHYNPRQRAVYEAVRRILNQSIAGLIAGKNLWEWREEGELHMQQELLALGLVKPEDLVERPPLSAAVKRYYPHGLGHPLGLDVHDLGDLRATLQEGWVMTVEPGIYIAEESMGVRIEENVLVTANGPINLTANIPTCPDAIEAMMRGEA